ncbi:MAG: DUF2341 domain-containing protein, partial [Bacteroidetes bacterium]|nr:DUF2341 domain-containing protein [Bacteroidota bacterium]
MTKNLLPRELLLSGTGRAGGLLLVIFCLLNAQMAQAQAWFDSNWNYRKAIIIDQSKVIGGPHTDFPLLIQITDDGLKNYAQNNGNDILFTASDGVTQLDHDIERFIKSSGALTAWIRIPSLSSGSNTVLYMYYGNSSSGNQANITGTWSSSFESVYHFDNNLRDRTSNAYNLSNHGTTNNNSGMFSRARTYNPSSGTSYTDVSSLMGNPSSITLSGWAYVNSFSSGGGELISLGDHVAIRLGSGSTTGFFYNGSSWYNTTYNTGYSGAWHFYCYTVDGVGNTQNLYVDGAQVASNSFSSSISYSGLGTKTVIGRHGNGSTNFDLGAVLDEVRVASVARSGGWIQTEYNNQNAPGSFYAVGDCESQQATVTSPLAYCRFASATQLSASGNTLLWSLGTVTGSCGGTSTLATSTWVDASSNNQKTQFSTLTGNVLIKSVDYYIPAWQTVSGVQLAIFNSSGTAIALSSTFTSQSTSSSSVKVTANFNALLSSAGSYSIGLYSGSGNVGGDAPSFPINESTGTLRVTGKSSSYRCYNNIQFDAGGSSTAPSPSTSLPGSTNYQVISSLTGCASSYSSIAVNVTDTVGTPIFTLGPTSSRCKMAGTQSYSASATNNTGISYALDANSLAAGNSINSSTGQVSYVAGWTGASTITATATGCGSNKTASHIATTTALTVSAATTRTCVGGSTGTISITAGGGIAPYTYSLNGGSYQASNSFSGLAAGSYTLDITGSTGCLGSGSASIAPYDTSTDAQDSSGTNTWVGHGYDGTTFNSYYGRFFEAETFNESFGGSTNCFPLRSGNDTSYLYTETFSARLRMNSSRRGLYAVNLGSDDGSRLTIDSVMVYSNWTAQSFAWKNNVLIPFTGTSKLLLEYYENSGGNQVAFSGLQLLVADTLSANTTQSICMGNSGSAISGDAIGTLPSGISKSGTGYQWTYSSSLNGTRTNITGATAASFTPSTLSAPFNTPGTYYVFRKVSLVSTNNVSPSSYTGTLESGAAVITVNAAPSASISYSGSPYCSNAGTASVTRTGTSGGTYSAAAGLSINTSTGAINLSASTAGSYTVTYTVAAAGGCALYQCTTNVKVTAAPSASISYPGNPFSNSGTANVSLSGTTGGTFSAGAGLSINATTGAINLNASTPGSYTVTYTLSASGGCSTYSTTASVSISAHYIFRSVSNGAWNQNSTWEVSQNSGLSWSPASTTPTSPGDTVFIAANDTVTVPLNVSVSQLRVYATGMLWPASGVTVSGSGWLEGNGCLRVTSTGNSSGDFAAQYPISGKSLNNLTVEFAGSSLQKMDAISFAKVRLNNAAGIQLSGAASIDSSLNFGNGLLLLGNYNLSLGKNISFLG